MITPLQREVLEADGWSVDCESPLEISHTDGSSATGTAAEYVAQFVYDYVYTHGEHPTTGE